MQRHFFYNLIPSLPPNNKDRPRFTPFYDNCCLFKIHILQSICRVWHYMAQNGRWEYRSHTTTLPVQVSLNLNELFLTGSLNEKLGSHRTITGMLGSVWPFFCDGCFCKIWDDINSHKTVPILINLFWFVAKLISNCWIKILQMPIHISWS